VNDTYATTETANYEHTRFEVKGNASIIDELTSNILTTNDLTSYSLTTTDLQVNEKLNINNILTYKKELLFDTIVIRTNEF